MKHRTRAFIPVLSLLCIFGFPVDPVHAKDADLHKQRTPYSLVIAAGITSLYDYRFAAMVLRNGISGGSDYYGTLALNSIRLNSEYILTGYQVGAGYSLGGSRSEILIGVRAEQSVTYRNPGVGPSLVILKPLFGSAVILGFNLGASMFFNQKSPMYEKSTSLVYDAQLSIGYRFGGQ